MATKTKTKRPKEEKCKLKGEPMLRLARYPGHNGIAGLTYPDQWCVMIEVTTEDNFKSRYQFSNWSSDYERQKTIYDNIKAFIGRPD